MLCTIIVSKRVDAIEKFCYSKQKPLTIYLSINTNDFIYFYSRIIPPDYEIEFASYYYK